MDRMVSDNQKCGLGRCSRQDLAEGAVDRHRSLTEPVLVLAVVGSLIQSYEVGDHQPAVCGQGLSSKAAGLPVELGRRKDSGDGSNVFDKPAIDLSAALLHYHAGPYPG